MRRVTLVALLAVACAVLPSPSPGASTGQKTIDGDPSDWAGQSTLLGGTWQVSTGEFVYQDYVYDDYGAETRARAPQHGNFRESTTVGDYRYPSDEDRYGHNAADIRELRLAADATSLDVLLVLNTLKATDTTVLGLAIDTDGNMDTGGGPWPYEAGLSTRGTEVVITLWGTGGSVTRLSDSATTALTDVVADTARNTIEARVPRSLVPGHAWRMHAATGLWDAAAETWTAVPATQSTDASPGYGGATIAARAFNVAFRDRESGTFFEERQAASLAAGDISSFSAEVDIDALGTDAAYVEETGRLYEAIVEQSFTIPPHHEGQSYDGVPGRSGGIGGAALEQTFAFYGAHQPYAVYVPRDYDAGTPLATALVLHGHGGAHCGYQCSANFLEQMGEASGDPMLLVSPLGRGSSMYADYGEQDVLEVLADATARWSVDADRLYVAGYSMGGYGALRFATLYPDRFAAAAAWAGYTGEFTGRYLYDQRHLGYPAELLVLRDTRQPFGGEGDRNINGDHVESLDGALHVPIFQLAGSNDEILPVTGQYAAAARLDDLGYRHRFDLYPGYEHLTFAIVDDWRTVREWFGTRTRVSSPRRVVYRYSDASIDPDIPMPIAHGAAYWVTATRLRESDAAKPSLSGRIDAATYGLPDTAHEVTPILEPSLVPTPNIRTGAAWTDGAAGSTANSLDVRLENLELAEISASGAALEPSGLVVTIVTDGPARVVVRGAFGATSATVIEGTADASTDAAALTVDVPSAGAVVVRTS